MKLLIDFGNSRCKWVLLKDQDWYGLQSFHYEFATPAESIERLLQLMPIEDVTEIHAVSVLGELFNAEFSHDLKHAFGMKSKFHTAHSSAFDVQLAYAEPSTYGADRYATLVAAHDMYRGTKIILDCGTATTVDVINSQGRHLGGLIMPGVNLMAAMLAEKASGISLPQDKHAIELLCSTTQDSVWSGSALSLRYGLAGIISDIENTVEEDTLVLVTGGETDLLRLTEQDYVVHPDLVLEGLQRLQG